MPLWTLAAELVHPGAIYALLGCITCLAVLLWGGAPRERVWALRTTVVFFLALTGLAASSYIDPEVGPARVVRAFCAIIEGLALIALAGRAIVDVGMRRVGMRAPAIMRDLLIVLTSLIFVIVRLHQEGVEVSALITTSAVLSVMLGIALQDTLGNLLGGLSLQLDDSVGVGDWIKLDGTFGRVTSVSWRQTSFHTNNGETVVVPNSTLVKNKFTVLGRSFPGGGKKWRRAIMLNADDEVPPPRVIETVERALRECEIPHVASDPPPSVVLAELELGVARYQVRYWLDDYSADDTTDGAVRTHLYFALRRADIALAAPTTNIDYAARTTRPTSRIDVQDRAEVARLLGAMDIFKPLLQAERDALAESIRLAPFAKGDVITRQGAEAHWLYVVADGEVEVVWQSPEGKKHAVAEIGPRDFFGEMGLLTGEPRTATVIAKTNAVCWRIDKQTFSQVIQSRPEMAESLSKTLTKRKNQLDELRTRFLNEPPPPKRQEADMLSRIRAFFNLE